MAAGGQRHAPAVVLQGKRPGTHCGGGWVGPRAGLDGFGKSRPRPPTGFDPRIGRPVASRYIDCAIRACGRMWEGSFVHSGLLKERHLWKFFEPEVRLIKTAAKEVCPPPPSEICMALVSRGEGVQYVPQSAWYRAPEIFHRLALQ